MINVEFELDRLKEDLRWKGYDWNDIDYVIELARNDINAAVEEILDNAMLEAAQIGEAIGADKFVEELQVMRDASSYRLGTSSGKTDFSEPPFPMLPKILKTAKVAKDGTRYQNIPIKEKTSAGTTNIFDMRARANEERRQKVQQRKLERDNARRTGSFRGTMEITGFSKAKSFLESRRQAINTAEQGTGAVRFRTATDKQNPQTQWVHPGKKMDMTGALIDINDRIDQDIENATLDIIDQYRELR